VAQDYEKLRIIVSDNFSQDNTEDVVRSMNDPRIKYVNPGKRLGMSGNWEFALQYVTAGYVTFLGDDDGLLPGSLLKLDEIISQYKPEAINAPYVEFQWPDNGTLDESRLTITLRKKTKFVSSEEYLNDLMKGYVRYVDGPIVYNGGFASIDLINRARHESGHFFCSQIPDVYSAVALASVTKTFLRTHLPLAVAGLSRHSNGSSHLRSVAPSRPREMFMGEDNIPYHKSLVFGSAKSIPLMVHESYLQSAHLRGNDSRVNMEDQIILSMLLSAPEDREKIKYDCNKISEINGIDKKICDKIYIFRRIYLRSVQLAKAVVTGSYGKKMIFDGSKFEADNVQDAASTAQIILVLMESCRVSRRKRFVDVRELAGRIWQLVR
jgi:glycosyltransferase involved in cell wall biosynthesis